MNRRDPRSDIFAEASPEALTAAIRYGARHLRPIMEAVRDGGCAFGMIPQGTGRFDLPKQTSHRPHILILGDDLQEARGPGAFHRRSVRRYLPTCASVLIVASAPAIGHYAAAAFTATLSRRNVLIIETRPEREPEWFELVQREQPSLPTLVITPDLDRVKLWNVQPTGGVH